jgi:hypothetical protein
MGDINDNSARCGLPTGGLLAICVREILAISRGTMDFKPLSNCLTQLVTAKNTKLKDYNARKSGPVLSVPPEPSHRGFGGPAKMPRQLMNHLAADQETDIITLKMGMIWSLGGISSAQSLDLQKRVANSCRGEGFHSVRAERQRRKPTESPPSDIDGGTCFCNNI